MNDLSDDELAKLVLDYMYIMKKCGRTQLPESEIMTFLGVPPNVIPFDYYNQYIQLTDTGIEMYRKASK